MIINLRGTNGAGKSHAVREIMEGAETVTPKYRSGRRKPLYYVCRIPRSSSPLVVLGHYEIPNGGVDTMSLNEAYSLIWRHSSTHHVLYEGRNMTDSFRRIMTLPGDKTTFVFIDTPLDECIQSVRRRGHSIAEKTIKSLYERSMSDQWRLTQHGRSVLVATRDTVVDEIRRLLAG